MKEVKIVMPTTIDEWIEISNAMKRETPMRGIPEFDDYNKCPVCGTLVGKEEKYCGNCGQRVEYVQKKTADPDNIPFEEMV